MEVKDKVIQVCGRKQKISQISSESQTYWNSLATQDASTQHLSEIRSYEKYRECKVNAKWTYKFFILMGDFNINLLNYESHTPTDDFIDNLGVLCFQPHIIQPTIITEHSATLVDNIYFNSIEHHCISGKLLYISDHLPNFLLVNKFLCSTFTPIIYCRDYSNYYKANLLYDVQLIDWEDVLPATDGVNLIFYSFHSSGGSRVSQNKL